MTEPVLTYVRGEGWVYANPNIQRSKQFIDNEGRPFHLEVRMPLPGEIFSCSTFDEEDWIRLYAAHDHDSWVEYFKNTYDPPLKEVFDDRTPIVKVYD